MKKPAPLTAAGTPPDIFFPNRTGIFFPNRTEPPRTAQPSVASQPAPRTPLLASRAWLRAPRPWLRPRLAVAEPTRGREEEEDYEKIFWDDNLFGERKKDKRH